MKPWEKPHDWLVHWINRQRYMKRWPWLPGGPLRYTPFVWVGNPGEEEHFNNMLDHMFGRRVVTTSRDRRSGKDELLGLAQQGALICDDNEILIVSELAKEGYQAAVCHAAEDYQEMNLYGCTPLDRNYGIRTLWLRWKML